MCSAIVSTARTSCGAAPLDHVLVERRDVAGLFEAGRVVDVDDPIDDGNVVGDVDIAERVAPVELACWRRSMTARRPSAAMRARPSSVRRTGSSARYSSAGAHPSPVDGRPSAGIADVEAAVDVEVARRPCSLMLAATTLCTMDPDAAAPPRRAAIQRRLVDYCRGVDRGDAALVASVYHPDGTDDHGSFKGLGIDFAEYVTSRLRERYEATMHTIANTVIDFTGRRHRARREPRVRPPPSSRRRRARAGDVRRTLRRPLRATGRRVEDRPSDGGARVGQGRARRARLPARAVHRGCPWARRPVVRRVAEIASQPEPRSASASTARMPSAARARCLGRRRRPELRRAHLERDRRTHPDLGEQADEADAVELALARRHPVGHAVLLVVVELRAQRTVVHLHGEHTLTGQGADQRLVVGAPLVVPDVGAVPAVRPIGGFDDRPAASAAVAMLVYGSHSMPTSRPCSGGAVAQRAEAGPPPRPSCPRTDRSPAGSGSRARPPARRPVPLAAAHSSAASPSDAHPCTVSISASTRPWSSSCRPMSFADRPSSSRSRSYSRANRPIPAKPGGGGRRHALVEVAEAGTAEVRPDEVRPRKIVGGRHRGRRSTRASSTVTS